MNDTDRLNWLEEQYGSALISDDFGHWAISDSGMQNVPENPPDDIWTSFQIEKKYWRKSVREAIDAMIEEYNKEKNNG